MKQFFQRLLAKFQLMDVLTKVVLIIFILLALVSAILAFSFTRNFTSGMTMLNLPGAPVFDQSQTNDQGEVVVPQLNELETEPWDGVSRVTILLLGLDYRDWQAHELPRSDTMILLTIDPVTKVAGILSVPRDLWVNIPNFGYGKINEAYYLGEANHLPGGGPGLAVDTIEQFIGIPIDYYAQIDFSAFIKFIDTLGGINVKPLYDVSVQEWGSEYKQNLKAGQSVTLSGGLALSYARDRYSGQEGDVDRARRQQEVIIAIKNQILSQGGWRIPELLSKAPTLYQQLSSGIRTDLDFTQAIQLGMLALRVDLNNIQKGVIDYDMMIAAKSADGLDILIPIMDKIRVMRDQVFSTGGSASPIASPVANSTLVRDEAARVMIYNGTTSGGLASQTAEYLRGQGINIVGEAQADSNYSSTTLFIYNAKPYTLAYLAGLMNVSSSNIWNQFDPNAGTDIAVILGNDWATSNSLP